MRSYQWIKAFSLASYLLILIPGSMIALPMGLCLLSWCVERNISLQLCSIASILGMLAIVFNTKIFHSKLWVDIIGFTFLTFPLINRLVAFPKVLGSFNGFYIPAISFAILFVGYLMIKYQKISRS